MVVIFGYFTHILTHFSVSIFKLNTNAYLNNIKLLFHRYFSDGLEEDETDVGFARSSSRRQQWARRSSELKRSMLVGLKLARSEDEEPEPEAMTFVTFREGQPKVRTGASLMGDQNFV